MLPMYEARKKLLLYLFQYLYIVCNTLAHLAVQHTCTTPQHTCYPDGATHMHKNVRDTLATLAVQPTCTKTSPLHLTCCQAVQPTCTKIVPSAFYYLIYHSKTIGDIQFLLWQRWSFLTDKVLTFPSIYFHVKMIYSKACALGFWVTRYPTPPKDPEAKNPLASSAKP